MIKKRVGFKYKGRKISLNALKCEGIEMGLGLMFRRRKKAPILLFDFGRSSKPALTSLFVFFRFVAVWLDDKNNVVDVRIVKPFIPIINSKKPFTRIVEIPINGRYSREIRFLVGNQKDLKR